MQKSFSFA
jgi:predicted transcriptional regulator